MNPKGAEIGMSDKRGSKLVKRRSWLDLLNCMCILSAFDMTMIDYAGDAKQRWHSYVVTFVMLNFLLFFQG